MARCIKRLFKKNECIVYIINIDNKNVAIEKEKLKSMMNSNLIEIDNLEIDKNGEIITYNNDIIDRNENEFIKLYHGSNNENINITYGYGDDKHDYGRGFYLTSDFELASEWAACKISENYEKGFVHVYYLDIAVLNVFNFTDNNIFEWVAELMKHRQADNSVYYKKYSKVFIEKYQRDLDNYDVITGWRADSSYFYIVKQFVRDNVDVSILDKLLKLGDLGLQYFLKSDKSMQNIYEDLDNIREIDGLLYKEKYNKRDDESRNNMKELIENTDINKLDVVFSNLIR